MTRFLTAAVILLFSLVGSAAAADTFTMQTGYYNGNGSDNRAITGLGFAPNLVLIKDDTTNGNAGVVFKTSSMAGEISFTLAETDAVFTTDAIQSLDSDGFTLGTNADVNGSNVPFFWIAFGGSDCSASGTFCAGVFQGTGAALSITSVGFQPDFVAVKRAAGTVGAWKSSSMSGTATSFFSATADLATQGITSLDATGFTVGTNTGVNAVGELHYFFAFKEVSGAMDVGTYTGNNTDNRNLTSSDDAGLTFRPQFVLTKQTGAVVAAGSVSEHYGDRSFVFEDLASAANNIQSLRSAGGFQVGTTTSVNAAATTYYYAAFGGTPAKAAGSGTFSVQSGTYSGTGAVQSITGLPFAPDLVIIRDNAAQWAVFRTSTIVGDRTTYLSNGVTFFANGITSLNSDGFSLGTSTVTNTSGNTYYYTAFGNAMRMDRAGGSSDFLVGQYLASGDDNTNVDRLPFAPDLVAVRHSGTSVGVWRTSNQSGDNTLFFGATALTANVIQALNSDGFQKGTNASINSAGLVYDFFMFKSGPGLATGTYTGTGSSQTITGAGFGPDLVWIKKTTGGTARDGATRTSAQAGDAAQPFSNTASFTGGVTALTSTGFTVNTSNLTNENTFTYQYASWQAYTLDQAVFRFFANSDSTDVGAALAAVDTTPTLSATGDSFRLRTLVRVDGGNLPLSSGGFKLQFVDRGAGTCASPSGTAPASYTDVTASTLIAYNDNPTPTDGSALTPNGSDPTDGARTIVNQSYEELNGFSNGQGAILDGQDGKWDFSLKDNGAASSTTYCFRVVRTDGSVLTTYTSRPSIITAADAVAPTVTISSAAPNPTNTSPIPVTFQFSETVSGFTVGDITVGNGTAGSFVAVDGDTYTAAVTPSGQGVVTVDVNAGAAFDGGSNGNTAATQLTRTYDSVVPTVMLSTGAGSATNSSPIPVTAQFSEPVTGFVVGDISIGNGSAGNFVAVDGDTYTFDVTPSGEGPVTVDIAAAVASDAAANSNTAAPTLTVLYDTVQPAVSVTSAEVDPTRSTPFSITIQFTESVSGFTVGDLSVGNGSAGSFVAVDGATYTANITPTAPGSVTVDISGGAAQDAAGNGNSAATQFSIEYDPAAINTAISSSATSPTNTAPIPITVQFAVAVTGFTLGDITVGGGTAANFVAIDGDTYTADVIPSGDGTVTVDVAGNAAQGAGAVPNIAAPQFSIVFDTSGPGVFVSSTSPDPTGTSPIPITIQFTEPVTGFVIGDITVGNGTAGSFVAVDGDTYTASITPSGAGAVTVDVAAAAAKDGADNDSAAAAQFSITYDNSAPAVTITSALSDPTTVSPIPITIQFDEEVTGFVIGDLTVGNGTAGEFVAVDGSTYTARVTPTGSGTVTVDVASSVAQDAAGNGNSAATQFSITYNATFRMQTGFYTGSGGDNRAITGLGFSPSLVLIKDDTAGGSAGIVMKTSSMTGELSVTLSETDSPFVSDAIQSLDSDGFTIGTNADVNGANVGFYWVAFGGSDCSASGIFCVGSYSGTGVAQTISTVGFQPDLVIAKRSSGVVGLWRSSSMAGTVSEYFANTAELANQGITSLASSGFGVGTDTTVNAAGGFYYYIAFKERSGVMDVGTYTGNGTDNRNLTSSDDAGLTFKPNFVFVKNTGANTAVASISENYGDRSFLFDDNASAANHIQALRSAGGFQVGNSANANSNLVVHHYAAFGGAQAKSGSGTYQSANGTYTGTGSSFSVTGLAFSPDLVIVKNNAAQFAVFRTSLMSGDRTTFFSNAATVFAGGITSINGDGFTIGTNATVNTASDVYYWTAFGNASRPDESGGASDFYVGQFVGSGDDNTDVDRLPFQPNLVAVKQAGATAGVWRTSDQSGDVSIFFGAAAQAANHIQAFNTDGFQKGTNGVVNTAGGIYDFFMFKTGTKFVTGTYTGTGAARNVTALGFQPDSMWIKKTTGGTARDGAIRTSAQSGDAVQPMSNTATATGGVTALLRNGFSAAASTLTNENTFTYQYAAWDFDVLSQAPYRFFSNANSTNVGAALAASSTPATLSSHRDPFRLRMTVRVDTAPMQAGEFKLQFVGKGSGTCAAPVAGIPSSYTDVGSSTVIGYYDNAGAANAAALTSNAGDPTDGGRTIVNQSYVESSPFSNAQAAIPAGQDGLWDFSLADNGALSTRTYCFRVVRSDGTVLDTYLNRPELTVPADVTPPAPDISTLYTDPINLGPIPVTIQFSEPVTGFTLGDIVVGNGAAGSFVATDADTYSVEITPTRPGPISVYIPGGVARDFAGNDNSAAVEYILVYAGRRRVIVSGSE